MIIRVVKKTFAGIAGLFRSRHHRKAEHGKQKAFTEVCSYNHHKALANACIVCTALVSCIVLFCSLVAQVGGVAFMGIDDIHSNSLSSWIESDGMGECDLTVPTCLCDLPKNLTGIRYCSTLGSV